MFFKKLVFKPGSGRPFQSSLMLAGKAPAYPREAPFRCSTQGKATYLANKH